MLLSPSDFPYSQRHLWESSLVLPREPVGFKNLLTSHFSISRATCAWRFDTYGGVRPALLLADCWRVIVHRRLRLAPRGTARLQRLGSDGMWMPATAHDVSAYTCDGSSVSIIERNLGIWRRNTHRYCRRHARPRPRHLRSVLAARHAQSGRSCQSPQQRPAAA